MASTFVFELGDRDTDEFQTRTFDVVGVSATDFERSIDEGAWFDWIEDIEEEVGTIDQTGGGGNGDFEWAITSSEIEDRDAFVNRVVTKLGELFGWTLAERP